MSGSTHDSPHKIKNKYRKEKSMDELQILNIDGVSCYEVDGTAYLKLEDVARGLGFTQLKNGTEYVRWDRIEGYLCEMGFPHKWGKGDFIPENIFYRLAMKAKNEVAEKFQAKVADEIIPSIRKHGAYIAGQEYLSQEQFQQVLGSIADSMKAISNNQITLNSRITDMDSRFNSLSSSLDSLSSRTFTLENDTEITTEQADAITSTAQYRVYEILGDDPEDHQKYFRGFIRRLYSDAHRNAGLAKRIARTQRKYYDAALQYCHKWEPDSSIEEQKSHIDRVTAARQRAKAAGYC